MRRLVVLLVLLLAVSCAVLPRTPADIAEVCTPATGYQGLAYDGTYFYVGSNTDNKIYKVDASCNAVTSFACPGHCAEIDIRLDHDTLLANSATASYAAVVQEITKTGTIVQTWDFSGEDPSHGYPTGGIAVTYVTDNTILFATCLATPGAGQYDFKIAKYTLHDDGTFVWIKTWSHASLGLPQGMKYNPDDGHVYYAVTVSAGTDNRIYRLALNAADTSITVVTYARVPANGEVEGLDFDGTQWYYNEFRDRKIKKFSGAHFGPLRENPR